MAYENYESLRIRVDAGIARLTMDHPPINLLDLTLIAELDRIGREVEADDSVRVVVLDSADPEFFAAHQGTGFKGSGQRSHGRWLINRVSGHPAPKHPDREHR